MKEGEWKAKDIFHKFLQLIKDLLKGEISPGRYANAKFVYSLTYHGVFVQLRLTCKLI